MSVRHNRARLEQNLEVFIKVKITASVATLTSASGELFETADITFTNTAAGDYTVTINPLKMPRGEAYCNAPVPISAAGTAFYADIRSVTYTNDSLAIRVQIFNSSDTLADPDGFFLHVFAC